MARSDHAVAFVVPVYNKARWLPRVLEQIAAQRGSFAREYIFVDDGSTDGSLSVLKRHTAGWRNVTIVEQANHGPAHATNRGIERATAPSSSSAMPTTSWPTMRRRSCWTLCAGTRGRFSPTAAARTSMTRRISS